MEECNHLNINNIIHLYMTSTVSEGYIEESKFENFWKFWEVLDNTDLCKTVYKTYKMFLFHWLAVERGQLYI